MIHAASTVLEQGIALPPLVVLGAGNTVEHGLQPGSRLNASVAAQILMQNLATRELVVTTGLGPDPRAEYPVSEARGMARIIQDTVGSDVHVEMDEAAHDTIENVRGVEKLLTTIGIGKIAVVGAKYHTSRFRLIAEQHPKTATIQIDEVHTTTEVSMRARVRECGQRTLYRAVTLDLELDDDRLERREDIYQRVVKVPKQLLFAKEQLVSLPFLVRKRGSEA